MSLLESVLTLSLAINAILVGVLVRSRLAWRRRREVLKKRTGEVQDARWRIELALEGADLVFWEWDVPSGTLIISDHGMELLGEGDQAIRISIEDWEQRIHPDDRRQRKQALERYFSGRPRRYECEYRVRHARGVWVWVLDRGKAQSRRDDTVPKKMFGTLLDISTRKKMEEELRRLALKDPLTGLANRRAFMERLEQECDRLNRHPEMRAAVAMLDIDHFKRVNDCFGHEVGDRVLVELAALLKGAIRANDMAGRLGGEEFAAILEDASLENAVTWAERVRRDVEVLVVAAGGGEQVTVTVSIGVARLVVDESGGEESLRRADAALYRAKREGRNRVLSE